MSIKNKVKGMKAIAERLDGNPIHTLKDRPYRQHLWVDTEILGHLPQGNYKILVGVSNRNRVALVFED